MQAFPLTNQESAANDGANWMYIVTADDLTQTTTNTKQTIKLMDLLSGDIVMRAWWRVKTFFQNSADAAFNSDTVSIGDGASDTQFIAAAEVNANGTTVKESISSGSVGPYTAAGVINLVMNSMTGKALNNLNKGEIHVFAKVLRPSLLEAAASASPIKNK